MSQQDPFSAFFAARDGANVAGGCPFCDAYQVIQAHVLGFPSLHAIHVYHAAGCPRFAAQPARKEGNPT